MPSGAARDAHRCHGGVTVTYRRAVFFALLAWTGCAVHKPAFQTYRLVNRGGGQIMIPPGMVTPDVAQRKFKADVATAGQPCPATEAIVIQPRKQRAVVTVRRDTLVKQPAGWLSAWTAEIEAQRCLAPGAGLKLADRIAESLPLEPNAAFRLLHSSVVDIDPKARIQVVSPILREGAAPDAPLTETVATSGNGNGLTVVVKSTANLIGFETAWYEAQPKANRIGFTIAPLFAERHIGSDVERRPQPATNYFQFPPEAAFYRLLFKAEQTDFTALVVAARTRAELDQRIKTLEEGTASCAKVNGELCVTIPKLVAVNQFLLVSVNGREVPVRWGGTVGEAIREGGERRPDAVLPKLTIHKLYNGQPAPVEFDRASPAILSLILTGGEIVSWR
jgi:hypothetical protein